MGFPGIVGFLFVVFPRPLVAAFTSDPSVAEVAGQGLRIISSGFLIAYSLTALISGVLFSRGTWKLKKV